MTVSRDRTGRFRTGTASANPAGRPKQGVGLDAAITRALAEKVTVTEQGKRRRKSKLDITATQLANKGAGGDMRAVKLALAEARKAEAHAEVHGTRAAVMTDTDQEIAARVIARLRQIITEGGQP